MSLKVAGNDLNPVYADIAGGVLAISVERRAPYLTKVLKGVVCGEGHRNWNDIEPRAEILAQIENFEQFVQTRAAAQIPPLLSTGIGDDWNIREKFAAEYYIWATQAGCR